MTVTHNRTLDWVPKPDPLNEMFRVASLDCYAAGSERHSIQRTKRVWLDQGREGACTGFGAEHVRALTPYPQPNITNESARLVYYEARRRDEWTGEDYEGSSVNGAMKAERFFGRISEWRWMKTMAEVRHALSWHGAVEIGVNWYTGMFDVDGEGFVHPSGIIEGGHALALSGFKMLNGARTYWLDNNWSNEWGFAGGCRIWEEDLQQLLSEDGEFACPKKVRL